jgi:hypothetical protein
LSNPSKNIDKEYEMKNPFSTMRNRSRDRFLNETSFSDEDGEVCTPSCRREALLRRAEQSVNRVGRGRY